MHCACVINGVGAAGVHHPRHHLSTLEGQDFFAKSFFYSLLVPAALNLLHPTGHVMHQQFIIKQLYVLPTMY
jgi:hypothetical protein